MGVLKIPQIPQYGVLVENTYGKDDSLFYEVYKGAAKNVADIITGLSENTNEHCSNSCIAFVGKRGTGKSSAMTSFANFLGKRTNDKCHWITDDNIQKIINNTNFYVLPPIDTANMSKKETIVANVSATMYSAFNEVKECVSVEQKRNFLELAQKTNDSAILKNSENLSELGEQILVETNKIVNIKNTFEESVQKFLEIVNKNTSKEKSFLVIQIDDLDMNVFNPFGIMEEIRNILSVKNVIILLSVDIKQLKTTIKVHYESSLDVDSCEAKNNSKDLAHKYIEKLLPVERRHYMPELTMEQLCLLRSQNFLSDEDKNWKALGLKGIDDSTPTPTVMNAFLHLVWRKTMIIPMRNEYGDYMLLPHNLRSLCNLIVLLRGMKDAAYAPNSNTPLTYFDYADKINGENYRIILEHNLRLFKNYIISNLESCEKPEMNLEDGELTSLLLLLIETLSNVNVSEINSNLVGDIIRKFNKTESNYYKSWFENDKSIEILSKATRYRDTISMGDVMYVLGKLDKKTHCGYIRFLIQVIRMLWSIKMTLELYVIGCNEENVAYCEPKAKYITRYFRDTVGAMMINPDTTEIFYWDYKKSKNDWSYSENSKKQSIYDLVIPKNNNSEMVAYKQSEDILEWRLHLLTGSPIYRGHFEEAQNFCFSHPMALFSNLLYPYLIEEKEPDKIFSAWQNIFIMIFPFYSMDYMVRLYETYIEEIRTTPFGNVDSIMCYVLNSMYKATKKLRKETEYYIPHISIPNKDEFNNLPFNDSSEKDKVIKEDFIFTAPISALINIKKWKYDLVLINKNFIEQLIERNKSIDPVKNYKELYDSDYFYKLWMSITDNVPDVITNQVQYSIKTHEDPIEVKKKIENLIKALEGKMDIVPFYYNNQIESIPDFSGDESET